MKPQSQAPVTAPTTFRPEPVSLIKTGSLQQHGWPEQN